MRYKLVHHRGCMGGLRQPETFHVLILGVLVGVAVGLFVTHSLDVLFLAIASLAAVWLVAWLWLRLQPQQPDKQWLNRGWRD